VNNQLKPAIQNLLRIYQSYALNLKQLSVYVTNKSIKIAEIEFVPIMKLRQQIV